jgi:hypothetical protein
MGLLMDISDGDTDISTGIRYDEAGDNYLIRREADVAPIISGNKKLYNDGTDGYGETREWRRAACIPNIILEKWLKEDGIRYWDSEDTPKLMAKLDDPEWRYLRTAPGHLGRKPHREFYRGSTS